MQSDLVVKIQGDIMRKIGLPDVDVMVDVETIGIFTPYRTNMIIPNAVFNVGVVLGHKGKIIYKEQVCIEEFWLYPEHRILDFYRRNFDESDFTVSYPSFKFFLEEYFYPLLKSFNGQANLKLYSYNADFDRRAFIDTASLENTKIPNQIQNNWSCVMVLASELLKRDHKYINWCVEQEHIHGGYEYISEGYNCRTKAETVYRYITQDTTFIEAHKGMQDCEIEFEILQWCKRHNGYSKVNSKPRGGGWQIFNYLALPFQQKGHLEDISIESMLTLENLKKLNEIHERRCNNAKNKLSGNNTNLIGTGKLEI